MFKACGFVLVGGKYDNNNSNNTAYGAPQHGRSHIQGRLTTFKGSFSLLIRKTRQTAELQYPAFYGATVHYFCV